jgi:DNA processing protein
MRADVADWVALNMVRGIGPRTANQLIDRFASPAGVFASSRADLERAGLKPDAIAELRTSEILNRANAELERVQSLGTRVITRDDESYPPLLRELPDPPIVLYVRGENFVEICALPCLAIVGSRRASVYGTNVAEKLARELAERGLTIISGLARGIDAAAHRGAVAAGGNTVAVIGTGIDQTYPKEHMKLASEITKVGAVISEFPLETPPLAQNFPYRNRVLSGLCFGVLVVEAAEFSGSLITARLAAEQGREVFSVPGQITSPNAFGPNALIKDGAKLVATWQDIIEELPHDVKATILAGAAAEAVHGSGSEAPALTAGEEATLRLLKPDSPRHIDEIISSSRLTRAELMSALLGLEMKDRIKELPGKMFVRKL